MNEDFEVGGPLPEESTNRTFIIAAAGLGGLLILSMICLAIYALVIAPRQREAYERRPTEVLLQNTQKAQTMTATALAGLMTPTAARTNTPAPPLTSTPTPVVVLPTNTTSPATPSATQPTAATSPGTTTVTPTVQRTATVLPAAMTATAAQATLSAAQAQTRTPTRTPTRRPGVTPTALPTTGFADQVGLPGLLLMAGGFLVVVVVARRLRSGLSP